MSSFEYSPIELDVIKELANIGGGNAASSISQLINKPVAMTVPVVEIISYDELFAEVMEADTLVDSVCMKMTGSGEGDFLFITEEEATEKIIHMMIPDGVEITDEIKTSALKELVNILVTSYLNAVAKLIDKNLISSIPIYVKDMFGAILSSVYIDSEQYDENVMIIKNEFLYEGNKMESSLYFVPRPGVLQKLFRLLGIGEVK